MKNLYEILEVNQNASQEIIEKAYRILAKRYHPDLNPENKIYSQQKMIEINKAYEILSSQEKRSIYDKTFSYQSNSEHYNKYKRINKPAILNKFERTVIKGIIIITFISICSLFIYLAGYFNEENSNISANQQLQKIYLNQLTEIRSEGLWKSGVNKEKTSTVLGKEYNNNLVAEIKLTFIFNNIFSIQNSRKTYASSEYLLNREYESVKGYVGIEDDTKNSELCGRVIIFGDDVEVFRSQSLKGGTGLYSFDIDTRLVDRLKFRLEASLPEYEVPWTFNDNINIGIFNCTLKKK